MADTINYLAGIHNPLLSDNPSVFESQLSRLAKNGPLRSRRQRNSLYRYRKLLASLPEDVRDLHEQNPQLYGLPRSYNIRVVKDEFSDHEAAQAIDGKTITFGKHGLNNGGLNLDGKSIDPSDLTWIPAINSYTFISQLKDDVPASLVSSDVAGHISFDGAVPTGALGIGETTFNVALERSVTVYDVDVSADAGAYWSTAQAKFNWDPKSSAWSQAHWEQDKFSFGYDINNQGDELQPNFVGENFFIDRASNPPTQFDLSAPDYGNLYTCIIGESTDDGALLETTVLTEPPEPPVERSGSAIKSVFPVAWSILFSPFADSFTGAFKDANGNVYAVKGLVNLDSDLGATGAAVAAEVNASFAAAGAAEAREEAEVEPVIAAKETGFDNMAPFLQILEKPVTINSVQPVSAKTKPPPFKVFELTTFNPMVEDKTDPSGYRDAVADKAMKDFQDIAIYHMDNDLRTTFISASQIHLSSEVLAIANDDSKNAEFYKTLSVPLITSLLAQGTSEAGKHCNGARANARLKSIPTDSEVYKRHAAKLYRFRFLERFGIQKFLDDQQKNQRADRIDEFSTKMKQALVDKTKGLADGNENFDKQLQSAKDDVDSLIKWAKDKNLYWAVELLYFIQNTTLRNWYAQYTSGASSSKKGMQLKQLNCLFGILENNAVNTVPKARNFMQAFNEDVRLFQMTAIIPQMVDVKGNSSEFDDLVKECLHQYIQRYKDVDVKEHQEAIKLAMTLYGDKDLRDRLFNPFKTAVRVGVSAMSWNTLMGQWTSLVVDTWWFKALAGGSKLLEFAGLLASTAFLLFPLLPGAWDSMAPDMKKRWYFTLAGTVALGVIKMSQNILRVYYYWGDIGGLGNILKVIFGNEEIIEKIGVGAIRVNTGWAKWVTRTSKQTTALAEELMPGAVNNFTRFEKIFGRNVGEFVGAVAGLILGIVAIVLIAIDMDTNKHGLLQAMDIIMLISSSLSVLAIVAGWVVAAWGVAAAAAGGLTATAMSACTLLAVWGGPLAIVFAIIGVIIYAIWYYLTDHRDPITKFVEDTAKKEGLWVDNPMQAPDYLNVVPASNGAPSLCGLSFRGPSVKPFKFVDFPEPTNPKFLQLDAQGKKVQLADELSYTLDSVWSHEVDPQGYSFIYTKTTTTEAKSGDDIVKMWYLATADDKITVIMRELSGPRSGDEFKNALPRIQWQVDLQEAPKSDKDKHVLSAKATIRQNELFLCRTAAYNAKDMSPGLSMVDIKATAKKFRNVDIMMASPLSAIQAREELKQLSMPYYVWSIALEPLGPGEFSYIRNPWTVTDEATDEINYPRFKTQNTSSDGLKWTIEPALDTNYFELITDNNKDQGAIRQKLGVKAPVTPAIKYTITCSLVVDGATKGTRSTTVSIEVVKS